MTIPDALRDRIAGFLSERGQSVDRAAKFHLLSGGNSHITWRLERPGDEVDLVIKVAQPDGPLAPYDICHEASMMEMAHRSGVPAPQLVGAVQEGDLQFLVMHHVEGEAPSLWEVRRWLENRSDDVRLGIGRSLLSVLADLSRVRPAAPFSMTSEYRAYLDGLLAGVKNAVEGVISLPPVFVKAHGWFIDHLGLLEAAEPALHHGDFRLGNAVFQNGNVKAVLDWERAMFGHPLHDLGFLSLPGMRNGDLIGSILTQDEIADLWQELMGTRLDFRLVSYFRAMSIFSELCYMVRAMTRLAQGQGRLTGLRPLPLIAELHLDLITGIQRWNDGNFDI